MVFPSVEMKKTAWPASLVLPASSTLALQTKFVASSVPNIRASGPLRAYWPSSDPAVVSNVIVNTICSGVSGVAVR